MRIRDLAFLVLFGATTLACSDTTDVPEGMTRARVLLTDAPFPYDQVASVDVYVVSVAASTSADTAGGAEWVTITEPHRQFDLLSLQGGATALIGEGDIPATQYSAVRLVIDRDSSGITLNDGSAAIVDWQGTGQIALHALVEQPLALWTPGTELNVVIDFDVGRSFQLEIAPGPTAFLFIPWIRAVTDPGTGVLAGGVLGANAPSEVLEPVPNASVTAYRQIGASYGPLGGYAAATGRTDAAGRYSIHFLTPGEYRLEVRPPADFAAGTALTEVVTVNMGETATLDVTLPQGGAASATVYLSGPNAVARGDTASFYATAFGSSGDSLIGAPIAWVSRNPAVGTLDPMGSEARFVASQTLGTTWIVASLDAAADSMLVSVVESDSTGGNPGGPVATVTLTPAAQAVTVGDSAGIWATLRDAQGTVLSGRTVTWSATDTTIARFEFVLGQSAMLRALKPGTITVTATSEGKSGSGTVTVN